MSEIAGHGLAARWRRLDKHQLLKWSVYSLLLLNWGFYAAEEFYMATHTLRQGGTFMEWAEAFATTIDELAWFGLLFMFELETYVLEDDAFDRRWVKWGVHGARLVCYVMLAHTVLARVTTIMDVEAVQGAPEVASLCQVADQEISWGENYRYETITAENCSKLPGTAPFFWLEPTVLTDSDGLALERKHVWIDLSDAVVWLLVIWAIELAVWLQNRDITGGRLMFVSHAARFFYLALFAHAAFWAWTGHWVYAWDQTLWILGFWAIERNLSEWREEIIEEHHEG
jgi:hypothetical protein